MYVSWEKKIVVFAYELQMVSEKSFGDISSQLAFLTCTHNNIYSTWNAFLVLGKTLLGSGGAGGYVTRSCLLWIFHTVTFFIPTWAQWDVTQASHWGAGSLRAVLISSLTVLDICLLTGSSAG